MSDGSEGVVSTESDIRRAFELQAQWAENLQSPITALLCRVLAIRLDHASAAGRRVLTWPGAPSADALPLRLTGALHALVRDGRAPELEPVYEGRKVDPDAVWDAIAATLKTDDGEIAAWLESAPQTNEVGRSGPLMAGLLYLADRFGLPSCELLELGSSAGLNLLMPRFAFDLGGVSAGDPHSPVMIAPTWRGRAPPAGPIEFRSARGVDVSPIDVSDAAQAARLVAYVWPEHAERLDRLSQAIALARQHPPTVDRQDAADWLKAQLALPQHAGAMRVVMHSVVWQYLNPDQQNAIETAMADHGGRATAASPLAWLAFELDPELGGHSLTARCWPGQGAVTRLAKVHPHGRSVEWLV